MHDIRQVVSRLTTWLDLPKEESIVQSQGRPPRKGSLARLAQLAQLALQPTAHVHRSKRKLPLEFRVRMRKVGSRLRIRMLDYLNMKRDV
jgi:hypothetical protein